MTNQRPPVGLEFKAVALTTSTRPSTSPPGNLVVETVVALTGADIGGGIEFAPGTLGRAFLRRTVKGTRGPSWGHQTAIVDSAVELPPGDPRLPARLPSGAPWPRRAGGMWVRLRHIDNTDGRVGLAAARAAAPTAWQIGFKSLAEHRVAGRRVITEVDVFQIWPDSLSGERPGTFEVKAPAVRGLDFKAGSRGSPAVAAAIGAAAADERTVVRCAVCSSPAALVVGGLPPGRDLVCADCVAGVGIDSLTAPTPTAEDAYAAAQRDEVEWELGLDGELVRARSERRPGRSWRS